MIGTLAWEPPDAGAGGGGAKKKKKKSFLKVFIFLVYITSWNGYMLRMLVFFLGGGSEECGPRSESCA